MYPFPKLSYLDGMNACLHPRVWRHCFVWAVALVTCLVQVVHGQEVRPSARPHLAIKVQAYSPLSWLAEQAHRDFSFPFTPRFWTGELELGLSDRHAIQASIGIMQLRRDEVTFSGSRIVDYRDGLRWTLAYRKYYQSARKGHLAGAYYSPFLRWVSANRVYEGMIGEFGDGEVQTNAISAGMFWGWQPRIGKHWVLDFGIGVEVGYQWYNKGEYSRPADVTSFDHLKLQLWSGPGWYYPNFVGVSLTASMGVGWMIF
jgi:hypothetical protein